MPDAVPIGEDTTNASSRLDFRRGRDPFPVLINHNRFSVQNRTAMDTPNVDLFLAVLPSFWKFWDIETKKGFT